MDSPQKYETRRHTLLLRLVGPMQSWGYRSRFDHRDTALEPTRSGVIGLLCAALGWPRDADLSRFSDLQMGVRVDAPGRVMTDYQTAQDVLKASGGVAATTQSWRAYVSDARFLVGLCGEDAEWLRLLDARLRTPVYPLFLGRKSYVPSLPPALPGGGLRLDTALQAALRAEPWRHTKREGRLFSAGRAPTELRLSVETSDPARGATSNDVPLNFARRAFALRTVERLEPVIVNQSLLLEDELCLNLNFFSRA